MVLFKLISAQVLTRFRRGLFQNLPPARFRGARVSNSSGGSQFGKVVFDAFFRETGCDRQFSAGQRRRCPQQREDLFLGSFLGGFLGSRWGSGRSFHRGLQISRIGPERQHESRHAKIKFRCPDAMFLAGAFDLLDPPAPRLNVARAEKRIRQQRIKRPRRVFAHQPLQRPVLRQHRHVF